MGSGKVYVVHNDWIKDPVNGKMPYKIGKTTADSVVDGRFHGIGLIMPGKFVCDFAYEFDGEQYSEIEEMLHDLLDDSKVNGEWYWVNERVLKGIRRACEKFGGRPITEEVTNEFAGEKKQRKEPTKVKEQPKEIETSNTTFKKLGIKVGTELVYKNDEAIKVKTVDEKNRVKYKGEIYTISNVATQLTGSNANGYKYFKYNGTVLDDIRRKKVSKLIK
jgi:hypothetical protein